MENMKKVKPSHYEVFPVYTCPACGVEHQQSIEETVFPAGILCYCGEKIRLHSIEDVSVSAKFSNDGGKIKKESIGSNSLDHSEVVDTLVNLGYKASEAKSLVSSSYCDGDTSEDLIEKIIARS